MSCSSWIGMFAAVGISLAQQPGGTLERAFRNPPPDARPHAYWLWLNGYVHPESARADLQAMKDAGFGGILMFDMGARGDKQLQPPAGPAFLSPEWSRQLRVSTEQAKALGLQFDFSVVSSWDLGGHWIKPEHASMGLYTTETAVQGGKPVDVELPFPMAPPAAPKGPDGKPAYWVDVAVLAARNATRGPGHEFVIRLDPEGVHPLREAALDNGRYKAAPALAATMTPTRDFSVAVSTTGTRDEDFREVLRGTLSDSGGEKRFPFPAGTKARYVRLRLLSGYDSARARWTLGEFGVFNEAGVNVAAARAADRRRTGAVLVRGSAPLGYDNEWNLENLNDGNAEGPAGVFSSAGPPPFTFKNAAELVDVTSKVGRDGRLRWTAPEGRWTILRFVCMNTGERLKVPSPNSDGWATDHLNPEATRAHMDYVVARLRELYGDPRKSGIENLYLASYEVRGPVWSPGFTREFRKRRGYAMEPFLPAVFGATVGGREHTDRFLFDYRKTLGEVLVDAYYAAAREAAHKAGLRIKSEAGGPGPPVHNVPVDALLANAAVDAIQGEFWPFTPDADAMWVVKETAAAGHVYGKRRVHMESFTSTQSWGEGPQDLKPSADRVFTEGANHIVWHTWTHNAPEAGKPGWAYYAGTHVNRNVTWWPKARPFIEYLARCSYLLQRGTFVADVLYYYGDGGYKFIGPRKSDPLYGSGYDYDVSNSDVLLNRLEVRDGRVVVPDGPGYAVLVLPDRQDMPVAVLSKIEKLVAAGATVIGPKPLMASGLEGYPASDPQVRSIAARLWGDLDGKSKTGRTYGKGRVVWGIPPVQVLAGKGIPPDFAAPQTFDFIHRRDGDIDIYFVRNKTAEPVVGRLRFRVGKRQPEFWNPQTGETAPAAVYRTNAEGVEVPVSLAANGSTFVVFRNPARPDAIVEVAAGAEVVVRNNREVLQARREGLYDLARSNGRRSAVRVERLPEPMALSGAWSVEFEAGRGAPARISIGRLSSWTDHSDPGVRFFSGTARYRNTFDLPPGWKASGRRVWLDLGALWNIAEVWLNGKPLGIVWTAPFQVDCGGALRAGANELVVEVTNTWHNRLVGDAQAAPGAAKITRTNVSVSSGIPWAKLQPIPSGLMGPVRLVAVAEEPAP